MSDHGPIDRFRKEVLTRRIPFQFLLRIILAGTALLCHAEILNAQKRMEGQLKIGDPNVMRELDGFQIKAFGYLDASHRGTSQVKETVSGDRGQFKIDVMDQGSIVAAFASDGSVVGWTWGSTDQTSVQLDVVRSSVISGQILERDRGTPVAGIRVRIATPVGDGSLLRTSLGRSVTSDSEGRFSLNGILPGIPYWIQVSRQILDERSPSGVGFENWIPFQIDHGQDWLLPTTWVRLNEQSEVRLAPEPATPNELGHPKSVQDAEARLEKILAGEEPSQDRVLLYSRGRDASSSESMDSVMAGLQKLLGDRFSLIILDPDRPPTPGLTRKLPRLDPEQTWVAVLNKQGQRVASFQADFQGPPDLFPKLPARYWLSSPIKANQLLETIGEAVSDLTLEEALQVVRLMGYASLPALAKFQ